MARAGAAVEGVSGVSGPTRSASLDGGPHVSSSGRADSSTLAGMPEEAKSPLRVPSRRSMFLAQGKAELNLSKYCSRPAAEALSTVGKRKPGSDVGIPMPDSVSVGKHLKCTEGT